MECLQYLTGPMSVLGAGVAGALVRITVVPPANRRAALAHVVSGPLMALFVAPAIVDHWLSSDSLAVQRGVALFAGLAGPLFAEIAVRVIQRRGNAVADRLVDRVSGQTTDKEGVQP